MKDFIAPGLVAGCVMLAASMMLGGLFSAVFPSTAAEYGNTTVFRPWSDPFMWYYFIHQFIMGVILSYVWLKAKTLVKAHGLGRGVLFGAYVWAVFGLPGMLVSLSSFQISVLLTVTWACSVLVQYVLAGVVYAMFDKN